MSRDAKKKKPQKKHAGPLALPGRYGMLAAMEAEEEGSQGERGGNAHGGSKGRHGAAAAAPTAVSKGPAAPVVTIGRFTRDKHGRLTLNRKSRDASGGNASKEAAPPKVIEIFVGITITELARKLGVSPDKVEKLMVDLGEAPASLEETVSADLIELIAMEVGKEVDVKEPVRTAKVHGSARAAIELESDAAVARVGAGVAAGEEEEMGVTTGTHASPPPRRAVVAVMGHVDHGKTTLLDTLRRTSVAAGEAGGITQHIGAFVVALPGGGELTFLDTPGHAAFSAMRARGASVTDVAVLVCAADDGVMPQTREAAAHILASNCRYVVALTKCDAVGADPPRVREELIRMGLPLEDAGGHVQCVEVSAHSGQGMEDLEMALMLEAEAMALTAPVDCDGTGVILEARLDKGQGTVATGLLQRGTLEVGEHIVAGTHYGRVKRLVGSGGVIVNSVGPSEPFELTGLRGVPGAGDKLMVVASEERGRRIAAARAERAAAARLTGLAPAAGERKFTLEHTHAPMGERGKALVKTRAKKKKLKGRGGDQGDGDEDDDEEEEEDEQNSDLNCIVKADVQGTAEAVRDSLLTLSTTAVGVKVVYMGVGSITESDVALAAAIGGPVLGFNVRSPVEVEKAAKEAGVTIIQRKVIYHLLDAVGELLSGLAPERLHEEVLGEAEVRQVFDLSDRRGNKANIVAGCLVNKGSLDGSEKFRVLRDGEEMHVGLLDVFSIRRHRLEVTTVGKGTDCGVTFSAYTDFKPGDVLQCIHFVKRKAEVVRVESGGMRVIDDRPEKVKGKGR
jgi:translation initiation factor IF-2